MNRALIGALVWVLVCVALLVAAPARANSNFQADAYSLCAANHIPGGPSECVYVATAYPYSSGYECYKYNPYNTWTYGNGYYYSRRTTDHYTDGNTWGWCVPKQCVAGDTPYGSKPWSVNGAYSNKGTQCHNGCGVTWNLIQSAWLTGQDPSTGYSQGFWKGTGTSCTASFGAVGEPPASATQGPAPATPTPEPETCGAGSSLCITGAHGACAQTKSGEWNCTRDALTAGAVDGCASGATGAICVGKNGVVPTPSDPPIPPNTPPSSSGVATVTVTNTDGSTSTYSVTINNYSGTSLGGSGAEDGVPGSSASGTNAHGSGNSGANGTDASGKCPDGSVPTASGCSGSVVDNGCDVPPQCHGDAVMCAQYVEDHKMACALASPSTVSQGDPTAKFEGALAADSVVSAVDVGSNVGGVGKGALDALGFGYSVACPIADGWHFTILGKAVDIPLANMCTPLSWLSYLVMAFAYLVAARIIGGGIPT